MAEYQRDFKGGSIDLECVKSSIPCYSPKCLFDFQCKQIQLNITVVHNTDQLPISTSQLLGDTDILS